MTGTARTTTNDPPQAQPSPTDEGRPLSLSLPWGLLGFEGEHDFILVDEPDSPIRWLRSASEPNLAFPTIEPFLICPDYQFELTDAEVEALHLDSPSDAAVLVIITTRSGPPGPTANLMAPIVMNRMRGLARQLVLSEGRYPLRYPITPPRRSHSRPMGATRKGPGA